MTTDTLPPQLTESTLAGRRVHAPGLGGCQRRLAAGAGRELERLLTLEVGTLPWTPTPP